MSRLRLLAIGVIGSTLVACLPRLVVVPEPPRTATQLCVLEDNFLVVQVANRGRQTSTAGRELKVEFTSRNIEPTVQTVPLPAIEPGGVETIRVPRPRGWGAPTMNFTIMVGRDTVPDVCIG